MRTAIELYERGLEGRERDLLVRDERGRTRPLPLARWLGELTRADADVLRRATAPVLDVGCGPGRHVLALAHRGVLALGVDVAPAAVRIARRRGAPAIECSVFDRVPGAGNWGSALLMDGNIGIGGHPAALLERVASLLRDGGRLLVELAAPDVAGRTMRLRLEDGAAVSAWYAWSTVSAREIGALAQAVGLTLQETWAVDGRWFACLSPDARSGSPQARDRGPGQRPRHEGRLAT